MIAIRCSTYHDRIMMTSYALSVMHCLTPWPCPLCPWLVAEGNRGRQKHRPSIALSVDTGHTIRYGGPLNLELVLRAPVSAGKRSLPSVPQSLIRRLKTSIFSLNKNRVQSCIASLSLKKMRK